MVVKWCAKKHKVCMQLLYVCADCVCIRLCERVEGGLLAAMSCHLFKFAHSPQPVLKCKASHRLNNKHVEMLCPSRQLDYYELWESNVNNKGMAHLPKGQTVSHQRHIRGQVEHNPF